MLMPNVEAMVSEVRGLFSEQGEGYWTFAECVAQCGANSLKISESDYAVRPSIHFKKKHSWSPSQRRDPFRAP